MSLRVDANCAFDPITAARVLSDLDEFGVVAAEQPIGRCHPTVLAQLKESSPIPIVADESLVTIDDAHALIDARACDYFNLRLAKCGGIGRTLQMAALAESAGLRLQLGSHVGETAILSAAGRHVAAHLAHVDFVEGSYGRLLLAEDVSQHSVAFGHGGVAPLLLGPGLGVNVREEVLRRHAYKMISLSSTARLAPFRKGVQLHVATDQGSYSLAGKSRESQIGASRPGPGTCSKTLSA
jgi:muconate cycloisomerase